jgi:predicted nucleic acid-binding protein
MKDKLGDGPVGLDTSIFIYFIEQSPEWLPFLRPVFLAASAGKRSLVTSDLTLLEVLVLPFRLGNMALAEQYEALLTQSRGLSMLSIEKSHLRVAAQLQARYKLRAPDSLQVATALVEKCTAFVTNDRRIPQIPGISIVQLSELA